MKLYHAADIHLGRRRLDGRLPDCDIADAFRFIAKEAIREKADVFLLAGDLFDRPQVEPPHLRQAQEILGLLKAAGIPVIGIEGNHDRQFVNTHLPTWVNYLAEDDLLVLLRPEFNVDGALLKPWDPTTRRGAYFDYAGIRFIGAGYLGAATPHKIRQMLASMYEGLPHVLLLHAGPEYFVGEGGGFSKEELAAVQDKVCYLALGHIHKPMLHGGWACNPGSPENCDLREAGYSRAKDGAAIPRGYAVIEIDPGRRAHPTRLEIRSNPRRPCHRIELNCSPFSTKIKDGPAAFVRAAVKTIAILEPEDTAVIELALSGHLNLNRWKLDFAQAAAEIAAAAQVFAVSIDPSGLKFSAGTIVDSPTAEIEAVPRDELERRAILGLVNEHPVWGLENDRPAFAELFYQLKEAVRTGQAGEIMANQIATSALIEKVRQAREIAAKPVTHAGPVATHEQELAL